MLKTLVVKINNMSSKFSSPFFKKSPLLGAYTSGAGGMVTVSYNDIHQKFQDGIAKNVAKHYEVNTNPCDDPLTTSYNKDGVYKTCPKKEDGNGSNNTSDGDNFEFTMPADLEAIANKKTKPKPKTSFQSTYDFLTELGKGVQDKAVDDINKVLDPNRNNQIR
tara:strand:+ start:268 stop:756 length:489 start_codon:yes stop_codon:yes gene_type:complete